MLGCAYSTYTTTEDRRATLMETAHERSKRKRRESRARAQGLHVIREDTPEDIREVIRSGRTPTVREWGLAKMAEAGRKGFEAGRQLRENILDNDGQCHGRTKLGMRCKRKTQGRWCGTHRKG